MTLDANVLSAARRVVAHACTAPAYGDGGSVFDEDLRALLPVLDALAAGADANRVERWARAMCATAGHADPDQPYAGGRLWEKWASAA